MSVRRQSKRSVWVVECKNEITRSWNGGDSEVGFSRKRALEIMDRINKRAKQNGWKKWQSRVTRYEATR
jgi:hypothetical protein